MKTLRQYINERWEEVNDEDTGEVYSVWIDDDTDDVIKKRLEQVKRDQEEYNKTRKEWSKLRDKLWELEDKEDTLINDIKDLKSQYKQLTIDMEDELGQLISKGEDPDKRAQEYGEEMDKISKEKDKLTFELKKLEKEISVITAKMNNLL